MIRPDGVYESQTRFGMYRWHIMDPIRFEKDLRVTIQALGWRSGGRYLSLHDDAPPAVSINTAAAEVSAAVASLVRVPTDRKSLLD